MAPLKFTVLLGLWGMYVDIPGVVDIPASHSQISIPRIVDISGWRRGHELVLCTSLSKLVNVPLGKILPSISA